MSHPLPPGPRFGPFGDRTFALLFVAAYAALLAPLMGSCGSCRVVPTAASGAFYLLVGTLGFALVERTGRLLPALAYFALQLALGTLVAASSYGDVGAVLLLLLLCGQAVRVLPHRWLVALVALAVTAVLLATPGFAKFGDAVGYGVGILAAAFFLVSFAQVAVGEQRQRAALDRANAQLRAYAAEAEAMATIHERNRLAREIHDGLGHYLTVINMQIEGARAILPTDLPRAERMLARAQTLTRETLADVRHSVGALRAGDEPRRPLPEALATLADEAREAGLAVALEIRGPRRPLPPQVDLALFRAAQEGLTNVRKHAASSEAALLLDYGDPAAVCLSVSDDGVGSPAIDGGFGLLGLRERVGLLGGAVAIATAPGRGMELAVRLPA